MEKPDIHEIVDAFFADMVEIIDVPKDGPGICLLRVRSMPEFAFVLWSKLETGTRSQMRFKIDDDELRSFKYPVVCACCPSERYINPDDRDADRERWPSDKDMAASFKKTLLGLCHTHGIGTLFMRKAGAWEEHYGDPGDVSIKEAIDREYYCGEKYGQRFAVDEMGKFIHDL